LHEPAHGLVLLRDHPGCKVERIDGQQEQGRQQLALRMLGVVDAEAARIAALVQPSAAD
jgi:hypothetical protein